MSKKKSSASFEWAKGRVLTQDDFNIADKEMLVKDFIYSMSVTLIYSPPKQGKTWLAYGVASKLARDERIKEVYYLDMDNSVSTLKERNVHETLMQNSTMNYLTRGTLGCEPMELLEQIASAALRDAYVGVVFFLDTTKDFVDTDNKSQSVQFMKYCVRLRDAGGTVIVLHHATKNKRQISGNTVFTSTPDNVYEMKQTGKLENVINYDLKVTHARGLVKDCRWSVDTTTLEFMEYDAVASGMGADDKKAVERGMATLREAKDGLSMTALVKGMGYKHGSDRNGKRLANELAGKYWEKAEKGKNLYLFYIKEEKEDDSKTESV